MLPLMSLTRTSMCLSQLLQSLVSVLVWRRSRQYTGTPHRLMVMPSKEAAFEAGSSSELLGGRIDHPILC